MIKEKNRNIGVALATLVFTLAAAGQVNGKSSVSIRKTPSLTICSDNFALVREQKDANTIEFKVEVSPYEEWQVEYTARIKY